MAIVRSWLRRTRANRPPRLSRGGMALASSPEPGPAARGGWTAISVPATRDCPAVGPILAQVLQAWPQAECRIYVGCAPGDTATVAATMAAASGDTRLRLVLRDAGGPCDTAACVNRLHAARCADEARLGEGFAAVVVYRVPARNFRLDLPRFPRPPSSHDGSGGVAMPPGQWSHRPVSNAGQLYSAMRCQWMSIFP